MVSFKSFLYHQKSLIPSGGGEIDFDRPKEIENHLDALILSDSLIYQTNSDTIVWSEHNELQWSDFKGKSDTISNHKAMTYVQVTLNPKEYSDSIVIHVKTLFFRNKSWTKNNESIELLSHEQLHFNIAELISRKIRKQFSSYEYSDVNLAYKILQEIYDDHYPKMLREYNYKYDHDSNHGTIKEQQREWELKIAKELKEMKEYSSTKVTVKRIK